MTRFRLVISLALALALAACGGAGRAPAVAPSPASAPVAPPSHAPAPPSDAAAPATAGHAAVTPDEAAADAAGAAQGDAASEEEDETKILEVEAIGPLRFDSSGAQLVKHLGAPRKKSPPVVEGATGSYFSAWSWPGVEAGMVADKPTGPWHARLIQVSAPIKLATKAGIRIGSTRKEVEAKYQRGSMDQGEPESFLAGSPYGGMYFTFKDGVVTKIGIGVFAF